MIHLPAKQLLLLRLNVYCKNVLQVNVRSYSGAWEGGEWESGSVDVSQNKARGEGEMKILSCAVIKRL